MYHVSPSIFIALHCVYTFCFRHVIKSLCWQNQRKNLWKIDDTCSVWTPGVIITPAASRDMLYKMCDMWTVHTHTHTNTGDAPSQLQRQIRKKCVILSTPKRGILYHVTVSGARADKNLPVMKVIHRPLRPPTDDTWPAIKTKCILGMYSEWIMAKNKKNKRLYWGKKTEGDKNVTNIIIRVHSQTLLFHAT